MKHTYWITCYLLLNTYPALGITVRFGSVKCAMMAVVNHSGHNTTSAIYSSASFLGFCFYHDYPPPPQKKIIIVAHLQLDQVNLKAAISISSMCSVLQSTSMKLNPTFAVFQTS